MNSDLFECMTKRRSVSARMKQTEDWRTDHMSKVTEISRESWIKSTFPEWGTWLNEEIENTQIPEGNVGMWWLGCTGIWFKTPADTNITIDLWAGNGKRTHGDGKIKVGHQMANMAGVRKMQPNLRAVPFVIDPFAVKHVDAVLATHYHQDHMSAEFAAHVIQSGMMTTDDLLNHQSASGFPRRRLRQFYLSHRSVGMGCFDLSGVRPCYSFQLHLYLF